MDYNSVGLTNTYLFCQKSLVMNSSEIIIIITLNQEKNEANKDLRIWETGSLKEH